MTDLARSITQAGRTSTYTADVNQNRIRSWTDSDGVTTTAHTNHYTDNTDSPSWTADGATYRRNIEAIGSGLKAVYDSSTSKVVFQVGDMHGSVIGVTASNLVAEPGLLATFETDEYGNARDPGDIGNVRYSFLGQQRRPSDNPGGVVLMGTRLYAPVTGRFLSVDPIYGGNASSYEYCDGDGPNCADVSGNVNCRRLRHSWSTTRSHRMYQANFKCRMYAREMNLVKNGVEALSIVAGIVAGVLTGPVGPVLFTLIAGFGALWSKGVEMVYDWYCNTRKKGIYIWANIRVYYSYGRYGRPPPVISYLDWKCA